MMTREEAIIKIRKVLALAGSANQNESNNAMTRVAELLYKYQLTISEIEAKSTVANATHSGSQSPTSSRKSDRFVKSFVVIPNGMDLIHGLVGIIVEQYFFVIALVYERSNGKLETYLIGEAHNVEIAKYVFSFLIKTFQELWIGHRRRKDFETVDFYAFLSGLADGVRDNLAKQKATLSESDCRSLTPLMDALQLYKLELVNGNQPLNYTKDYDTKNQDWNVRSDARIAGAEITIPTAMKAPNLKKIA